MPGEYKVRVLNDSYVLKAEFADFLELGYSNIVNDVGVCTFMLNGDHSAIPYLITGSHIEIWRKENDENIDWYCDYRGYFEDEEAWHDPKGQSYFRVYAPERKSVLGWRVVNWSANNTNQSAFTNKSGEYIMKRMVDYNLGPNATTGNGRKVEGTISWVLVSTDQDRGTTLDWNCHGDDVLKTLQKLAPAAGLDFNFISSGTASMWFEVYPGQLGTDRSTTLTFSLGYGNMAEPKRKVTRSTQKTYAAVWGKNEENLRDYVGRTGDTYSSPWAFREVYVDAKNSLGTTNAYNSAGDAKLKDTKAYHEFEFKILQTPSAKYGRDYFLGDKALGEYGSISQVCKIQRVDISMSVKNGEKIDITANTRF